MRIACLVDSGYEDSEFRKPYQAFRAAGHEVVVIGLEAGKEVRGKRGEDAARIEKGIGEVRPDDFGNTVLELRFPRVERSVEWAERFDARILLHEADRAHIMRPSDRIERTKLR